MKTQIFTLLTAASLLCGMQASAQITLSSSNTPSNAMYIGTHDSLKYDSSASVYPNLQAATNAMWDLSTIVYTTANGSLYHVAVPASSGFNGSAAYYDSLSGNFNAFYSNTASGIVSFGYHVPRTANSAGTTAGDSLITFAQDVFNSAADTVLPFPATLGRSWSSSYSDTVMGSVTYHLGSIPVYNNSPTQIRTYTIEKDTVVGWGSMSVKMVTNGSQFMPVLQVKRINAQTDSAFINGTPAPSSVLSLIPGGFTQGQITTTYTMDFYRANEIVPLASINFTDATFSTPSSGTIHYQRLPLTVSSVLFSDNISVYPNPLSGNIIHLQVPSVTGTWSYELINMDGKIVSANTLSLNGTTADISLTAPLAKGIYFVRLSNNGKQVSVKALEVQN